MHIDYWLPLYQEQLVRGHHPNTTSQVGGDKVRERHLHSQKHHSTAVSSPADTALALQVGSEVHN